MKIRRPQLFSVLVLTSVLFLPVPVLACACCSNTGDYQISFSKPADHEVRQMKRMRFGGTAYLFQTEAGLEANSRGIADAAENYSMSGSLAGRLWKLNFRNGDKTGVLNLPLPLKMINYSVDTHNGQTSGGGGPQLYKEWRFEGTVSGSGFFVGGIRGATKYFLVLQGRGNRCDNAADFTNWRLKITGPRADYAFYGELADPLPDEQVK